MARLSETGTFYDRLRSDACEWRYGESRTAECILYEDPTGDALQDLSGATVEAHAEHYLANVETQRVQDGATTLSISKMRLQTTPVRDLQVIVLDQTVAGYLGRFDLTLPSDLFPSNPGADETKAVPVVVVYVTHLIDGELTHQSFPLVCRRGSPS